MRLQRRTRSRLLRDKPLAGFRWLKARRRRGLPMEQLLDGIPVRNPNVEREPGAAGRVILRGPAAAGRARGEVKRYELDELGDWLWRACDGQTSVERLIQDFTRQYRVNPREGQVAVISFLNMLRQRNLVVLVVGKR